MAGYTRQSAADIQDGNIVEAQPLNNEYNALQSAFSSLSGHKHDGTAGEGAPITVIGPTRNVYATATSLYPRVHNTVDLGTTDLRYQDLYLSGAANITGNVNAAKFVGDGSLITGIADTALPTTIVRTSRTVSAGNGLTGGGDLSTNRAFAVGQGDGITVGTDSVGVDGTVVRTSGTQTLAGTTNFTSDLYMKAGSNHLQADGNKNLWYRDAAGVAQGILYWDNGSNPGMIIRTYNLAGTSTNAQIHIRRDGRVIVTGVLQADGSGLSNLDAGGLATGLVADARLPSNIVRTTRAITAGNGLTGGGDLTANRAFAVGQGDGITVGATTVGVDSTVVRTSGDQNVIGTKNFTALRFTGEADANNNRIRNLADPTADQHAANKRYVDSVVTGGVTGVVKDTRAINTGLGLSGGGNLSADRVIAFNPASLNLKASGDYTNTPRFVLHDLDGLGASRVDPTAARELMGAVPDSRTITAGNGLTGGGNLQSNRAFAVGAGDGITVGTTTVGVDSTVLRTTGNQTITGTKTFSNLALSGPLSAGGNVLGGLGDPTANSHAATKGYVDSKGYVSGWTAIANAGSYNFTHNLGTQAVICSVQMKCKVAEGGYAVGDIITIGLTADLDADDEGMGMYHPSTTVTTVVIGENGPGLYINKPGGPGTVLKSTAWDIRLLAQAIS